MTVEAIVEALRDLPGDELDRVHREVWEGPITEEEERLFTDARFQVDRGEYVVFASRDR